MKIITQIYVFQTLKTYALYQAAITATILSILNILKDQSLNSLFSTLQI